MKNKVAERFTIVIVLVCMFIISSVYYWPNLENLFKKGYIAYLERRAIEEKLQNLTPLERVVYETEQVEESEPEKKIPEGVIRIPIGAVKPGENPIEISYDYLESIIYLDAPNAQEEDFEKNPIVGCIEHINDLECFVDDDGAHISLYTDGFILAVASYDDEYAYLSLNEPHDIYKHVVAIDAGHGGNMPGMIMQGMAEKDINLAIALKLKRLLEDDPSIYPVMTREDDNNVALGTRASVANTIEADILVSIHQNAMYNYFNDICGTQTLYYPSVDGLNHKIAEVFIDEVTDGIGTKNKGVIKRTDLVLLREAKVPSVLVEVAFMTNAKEFGNLITDEYQEKVALSLYEAIKKSFEMEEFSK